MREHSVRIHNTSQYPNDVVRTLVRLACNGREHGSVGLNIKNSQHAFRGRAYSNIPAISNWRGQDRRYLVVAAIGDVEKFPIKDHQYPGLKTAPIYTLNDWMEGFVFLIAHELTHCEQFKNNRPRSEIEAEISAHRTLEYFRTVREAVGVDDLMRDHEAHKTPENKKATRREEKLDAIREKLFRWERKLKLATTKTKKLRRDLARMEKAHTATPSTLIQEI